MVVMQTHMAIMATSSPLEPKKALAEGGEYLTIGIYSTPSILNYKSFDFFYFKFDHSFYLKIYIKYHFFCYDLLY